MELTQIRITRTVVTPRYGALAPGDLLRTDAAFARHLVEDCAAAKYIPRAPQSPAQPKRRRNKETMK